MKLATTLTSIVVLTALAAFVVTPAGAEDELAPPAPPQAKDDAPAPPAPIRGPRGLHLLLAADENHDRSVSAEEWKAFLERLATQYAELDKDGDGALSAEELPRPPRGPRMRGGPQGPDARGPGMRRPGHGGPGMRGPGMRGPGMRGPGMQGLRTQGPGMGPRGMRGPGMGGPGMQGPRGPRGRPGAGPGPESRGPQQPGADLGPRLDRLTAALERLLERMERQPPR